MGCNNEKSYSYISSEYDHENIIRQYEEETLKCFHKTFNSLMLSIASEEDIIPYSKVEELFLKEYSEDMLKFVQEKYKTEKGYKASTIKNLIYITCPDMPLKTAKSILHDKLGFIISNVKSNLDESMSSPMNIEDIDLDKLIGELFDIACIDIVDNEDKLNKATSYIAIVIEFYLQYMIRSEIEEMASLMINTYLNINDLIVDNKKMIEVLGNLLFILIDSRIIIMKKLNLFEKKEKSTIKNLCCIVNTAIEYSGTKKKRMYNDFKQIKVFKDNESIFNANVPFN